MELLIGCGAGSVKRINAEVPREYLVVDETRIRKVVQALKGDSNIPGVRVYSEEQIAASAA